MVVVFQLSVCLLDKQLTLQVQFIELVVLGYSNCLASMRTVTFGCGAWSGILGFCQTSPAPTNTAGWTLKPDTSELTTCAPDVEYAFYGFME